MPVNEDKYQQKVDQNIQAKISGNSPGLFDNLSDRGVLLLVLLTLVLAYVGTFGVENIEKTVEFNSTRCINLGNNMLRCDILGGSKPNYAVGVLGILMIAGILYLRNDSRSQPVLFEEEAKTILKSILRFKQTRVDWEVPDGDIFVGLEGKHREWGYRAITGEAKKFPWYWIIPFNIREVSGRKRSFIAHIYSSGLSIGKLKAITEVSYYTPEPDVVYVYMPVDTLLAYKRLGKIKSGFGGTSS